MAKTTDRSSDGPEVASGLLVKQNPARAQYETAINDWVRGDASLNDVFRKDPYQRKPSVTGFLRYFFTGTTRHR